MAKWPYSTAAWSRLRLAKLAETPLCEDCRRLGKLTVASHVDHRVAINLGGPAFPPLSGLASLCPSCHAIKTNREDMPLMFPKGCDVNGFPLDVSHPFNEGPDGGASDRQKGCWGRAAGDRQTELVRVRRRD